MRQTERMKALTWFDRSDCFRGAGPSTYVGQAGANAGCFAVHRDRLSFERRQTKMQIGNGADTWRKVAAGQLQVDWIVATARSVADARRSDETFERKASFAKVRPRHGPTSVFCRPWQSSRGRWSGRPGTWPLLTICWPKRYRLGAFRDFYREEAVGAHGKAQ